MNKDKHLVKVWNIEIAVNGDKLKVATIEQPPRKPSMCDGCSAPCCRGILYPVLNEDEFLNRKFTMQYMTPPEWLSKDVPNATHIATLAVDPHEGCPYYKDGLCSVWPNPPASCRAYDCREDDRKEIKEFAKNREKTWQEQ